MLDLPGVATRIETPFRSRAFSLFRFSPPDKHPGTSQLNDFKQSFSAIVAVCVASSRVGHRIRHLVPPMRRSTFFISLFALSTARHCCVYIYIYWKRQSTEGNVVRETTQPGGTIRTLCQVSPEDNLISICRPKLLALFLTIKLSPRRFCYNNGTVSHPKIYSPERWAEDMPMFSHSQSRSEQRGSLVFLECYETSSFLVTLTRLERHWSEWL